jgi:hypothetical protein
MKLTTCGIDIDSRGAEYTVLGWSEGKPHKIATGRVHGSMSNKQMGKRLKRLVKAFSVDLTAISPGTYCTQDTYEFVSKNKKNIVIVKGQYLKEGRKNMIAGVNKRNGFRLYSVYFTEAKHEIVSYNQTGHDTTNPFAIAVMAKEIASLK